MWGWTGAVTNVSQLLAGSFQLYVERVESNFLRAF